MMAEGDNGDYMEIDGSILEGGGQILRNSISLAAILSRPVKISKIRGGRRDPGLKPQHLTGLQLVNSMCGGQGLNNAYKGSTEISFWPQQIQGGHFVGDTGTAGAICLLAQVTLPVSLFADRPTQFVFRGGTDVDFAPPIDFFTHIFVPFARKFGVEVEVSIVRRGFFPRGGGEVQMQVQPVRQLTSVEFLSLGRITGVRGQIFVCNLSHGVSRKIRDSAMDALRQLRVPVNIEVTEEPAPSNTRVAGITLIAENESGMPFGTSTYSRRGVPPEEIGREAAAHLIAETRSGGCVGEHLSDQLIILMALASGRSTIRTGAMSMHLQTSIHICEKLLGVKFDVNVTNKDRENVSTEISCTGIGFVNERVGLQ